MADIEKVIKALEACLTPFGQACYDGKCPYANTEGCQKKLKTDALELLREYKRHDECPCTHCLEWECDDVCEEYKKWKDT